MANNLTNALFALLITSLYVMGHEAFHYALSVFGQLVLVRLVVWRIELVFNWRGILTMLLSCVPNQLLFYWLLGSMWGPYGALASSLLICMYLLQSEDRWYGAVIWAAVTKRELWFEGDAPLFLRYDAFCALYHAELRAKQRGQS